MSEQMKDGGPAFPVATGDPYNGHQVGMTTFQFPGMSLRDWFAGQAMQSFINWSLWQPVGITDDDKYKAARRYAGASYCMADAMLAARAEGGGEDE